MRKKAMRTRVFAVVMTAVLGVSSILNPEFIGKKKDVTAAVTGSLSSVSVHDPSIIADTKDGNTYYIFGTHIEAAKSTDLANWESFSNGYAEKNNKIFGDLTTNLAEPFQWAGDHDADCKDRYAVWAPDVKWNPAYENDDGSKGAYMMYFCTSSTYCRSVIAYAVSDKIEGPYQCKGTLVYSGFTKESAWDEDSSVDKKWTNTNIDELMAAGRIDSGANEEWFSGDVAYNTYYAPNAIDPTIITDLEGKMWMVYGSWSGGIFILEIDPKTGDAIYPKENGTTEDGRAVDKYFGTHLAGGCWKSGEGPYIIYDEETEYYYLYTTYNYLDSVSGYNMRLFRSKNLTGPYQDAVGNSAVFASDKVNQYNIGIKVMGNYNISGVEQGYRSPGHNSVFIDSDGQRYLIYHTRFQNAGEKFETRVHQQFMNDQGWPVTAVYENRGDQISKTGYSAEEIAGTYHFINHGTASDDENVNVGETVILSKDGAISGSVTGTWTEKEDSYFATLTIDGTEYHGVFFKQHDEKGTSDPVMTFTAIGSNNMTVWGTKVSDRTEDLAPEGTATSDFTKINTQPVLKYTFDNAEGIKKLAGVAVVEDGVLKLESGGVTKGKTYAELAGISNYDFSDGITLTADIVVNNYMNDWTPIFMISDTEVGSNSKTYPYHFTQGFSSVADLASGQIGYYGNAISQPYSWDYFSDLSNRYKWYTVTVVITNKNMETYINGIKVQSDTQNYTSLMEVFARAQHVYLGGSVFINDYDFSGWMDNVAIYDKALTSEAVKAVATGQTLASGAEEVVTNKVTNPTPIPGTVTSPTPTPGNVTSPTPTPGNVTSPTPTPGNVTSPTPTLGNVTSPTPTQGTGVNTDTDSDNDSDEDDSLSTPSKGTKLTDSKTGNQYKVTKAGKTGGTVAFVSPKNKKVKSVTIPATVKLKGITYKVSEIASGACKNYKKIQTVTIGNNIAKIGKNAFLSCVALKKITIKATKLKESTVGAKAFAKINAKAVVKVPKSKKEMYRSILKKKGLSGKKQKVK